MGHISLWLVCHEIQASHIADNSDDLPFERRRGAIRQAGPNTFPNRVFIWKNGPGEAFANNHHRRRASAIADVEIPSPLQRNSHGLKVIGSDRMGLASGQIGLGNSPSSDFEIRNRTAAEGQGIDGRRRLDLFYSCEPVHKLDIELSRNVY